MFVKHLRYVREKAVCDTGMVDISNDRVLDAYKLKMDERDCLGAENVVIYMASRGRGCLGVGQ